MLQHGGKWARQTLRSSQRQLYVRALIFRRDRVNGQHEILSQFDFDVAFLQADQFGEDERVKHVTYRPHPGYPDEIYELTGPLYGSDDAKTMHP